MRDAETEELMRDYAAPIFDAAGISRQQVEIILVNRNDFNAFVADARRIFINVGVNFVKQPPSSRHMQLESVRILLGERVGFMTMVHASVETR